MSLERFTQQLAAAGAGALPDGEHIGTVVEIRPTKAGGCNVFVETAGGRRTRHFMREWGEDTFALGETVTLKVWRRQGGLLSTSLRSGAGVVFANDETSLTTHGELQGSVQDAVSLSSSAAHATPNSDGAFAPVAAAGEALDTPGGTPSSDAAFDAHRLLLQGLYTTRMGLSDTAQACYLIREGRLYRELGYEKLGDYLADPDISLRTSSFHEYADIWKRYVLEGGIEPGRLLEAGRGKLAVPLPALKRGEVAAEEALEDAVALGAQDLRVKYRGEPEPVAPVHDCPRCRGLSDEQLLAARHASSGIADAGLAA